MIRSLNSSDEMAKCCYHRYDWLKEQSHQCLHYLPLQTTIYTPYIARVKKDQAVPLDEVRSGFTLFSQA